MDLIAILQQFVNMQAVLLAVFITQGVKCFLPSPSPVPGEVCSDVVPGSISTRLLPFLPIIIGVIATFLIEPGWVFTTTSVLRGIMSGIAAAYGYRTMKVSIFGE